MREIQPTPEMRVLDVGFNDFEHTPVDNYLEKHYPYLDRLTALGMHEPVEFPKRYPMVKVMRYDGDIFPFQDKEFDVCWSNAVIEHVGGHERQHKFLSEITRVSKRAFITTPYRYFPIEVHTLTPFMHFFPKPVFDRYLKAAGKSWATGDYLNLLSVGDMKKLLRECGVKKYKILHNRLGGVTLDFVTIIN